MIRVQAQEARKKHKSENPMPVDPLASTFKPDEDEQDDDESDDGDENDDDIEDTAGASAVFLDLNYNRTATISICFMQKQVSREDEAGDEEEDDEDAGDEEDEDNGEDQEESDISTIFAWECDKYYGC